MEPGKTRDFMCGVIGVWVGVGMMILLHGTGPHIEMAKAYESLGQCTVDRENAEATLLEMVGEE